MVVGIRVKEECAEPQAQTVGRSAQELNLALENRHPLRFGMRLQLFSDDSEFDLVEPDQYRAGLKTEYPWKTRQNSQFW